MARPLAARSRRPPRSHGSPPCPRPPRAGHAHRLGPRRHRRRARAPSLPRSGTAPRREHGDRRAGGTGRDRHPAPRRVSPPSVDAVRTDTAALRALLATEGLVLVDRASDPLRPPRRILRVPRYAAMEAAFDRVGPHGRTMMCSTSSVQVCLDAGDGDAVTDRWHALHEFGPTLVATFANSPAVHGRRTGWKSSRMASWLTLDPERTSPPSVLGPDPAAEWAERALDTSLLGGAQGRRVEHPARRHVRRLDRGPGRSRRPADASRPRLPPDHALPAGPPARARRGPLPRPAARGRVGGPGRGRDRAALRPHHARPRPRRRRTRAPTAGPPPRTTGSPTVSCAGRPGPWSSSPTNAC